MNTTTIKLHTNTKNELDTLRNCNESYDDIIKVLISKIKNKKLNQELVEAYKSMGQSDLDILEEWETASREV